MSDGEMILFVVTCAFVVVWALLANDQSRR